MKILSHVKPQPQTKSCPPLLVIHNQQMETSAELIHLPRCMGNTLWHEGWSYVVQIIDVLFSFLRRKNRWTFHKWRKAALFSLGYEKQRFENLWYFQRIRTNESKQQSFSYPRGHHMHPHCAVHYEKCIFTQSEKKLRPKVDWIWHELSLYMKAAEEW